MTVAFSISLILDIQHNRYNTKYVRGKYLETTII